MFNWSGGKDSALALWQVMQSGAYEIVALLTTVNGDTHASSMHAIPSGLLAAQAEAIGLPLRVVDLPPEGNMQAYEEAMRQAVTGFRKQGVTHFIFGDIFLHDVRAYRERQLAPYGITVVEPLWNEQPEQVMEAFLASGIRTVVVTTAAEALGREYLGQEIDRAFIGSLPAGVDPCGENGEYHTFCFDGPVFRHPVPFRLTGPRCETFPVRLDDGTERMYAYWFAGLSEA